MADTSATLDAAARTAEGVATQAASGNVWAFGVFVVLILAGLLALWIWRSTGKKQAPEGHDDDPDPSCEPKGGCPGIRDLSNQVHLLAKEVDHMTKSMEVDREERRDHRTYVEGIVRDFHSRVDSILLGFRAKSV